MKTIIRGLSCIALTLLSALSQAQTGTATGTGALAGSGIYDASATGTATANLAGDILTLDYTYELTMITPPGSAGEVFTATGTLVIDYSGPGPVGTNTTLTCTPPAMPNVDICPNILGATASSFSGDSDLVTVVLQYSPSPGVNDLTMTWAMTYDAPPEPPEPVEPVPTLPLFALILMACGLGATGMRSLRRKNLR